MKFLHFKFVTRLEAEPEVSSIDERQSFMCYETFPSFSFTILLYPKSKGKSPFHKSITMRVYVLTFSPLRFLITKPMYCRIPELVIFRKLCHKHAPPKSKPLNAYKCKKFTIKLYTFEGTDNERDVSS
jgi:hypothetical protein